MTRATNRLLGRAAAVTTGLAAVLGTALAGAPTASAVGSSIPSYLADNNSCIGIDGSGYAILWSCNGNPDQRWTFAAAGGGYVRLANEQNGCLDIPQGSTAPGTWAIQWQCNNGTNQQWKVENLPNNSFRLRNRNSGLCLDASGASSANGTHLIQWDCNGGDNQRWLY
ncbi:RICIN domain-containing protein [Streptomyces sp. NPDC059247]|uniref:RICIN domain-containing protein n=1 Tax=Streptomyces sp. NPDC059247 TaxID=3346790 RepID=UPI00367BA529